MRSRSLLARFRNLISRRRRKASERQKATFLSLEKLEERTVPTLSLAGIPTWGDQGPRPIISTDPNDINVVASPGDGAGGAVESLAIRQLPNSSLFQLYAATVNGGVWRSDNADPAHPENITWTPLTDQQSSLAMGSIAFSPLDASGNTLFVGTGTFSNLVGSGGPVVGVMRTTDGGTTWNTFELNPTGSEKQVKTVLPTTIDAKPDPWRAADDLGGDARRRRTLPQR